MNDTYNIKVKEEVNDHSNIANKDNIVSVFQMYFFAMRSVAIYPWNSLEMELQRAESADVLLTILEKTCLHSLCLQNPPSVKYRRLFLTELIKRHEHAHTERLDELYDAFGAVLGSDNETVCYKSYFLPAGGVISLSESVAAISEGTTGLVTWEAALFLAEWAMENKQIFEGRSLLELGSGVGLTGAAVCKSCNPARYTFTDGHAGVLQRLRENVRLNGLGAEGSASIAVEQVDWESATDEQLRQLHADAVIAADVAYDPDVICCLVTLLVRLLRCGDQSPPDIYIASTIRNPDTYSFFKSQLAKAGTRHHVLAAPVTQVFPYSRASAIEIIKVYL